VELVCSIIHDYTFDNSIPIEEVIIIDEIGFLDKQSHNLLYKLLKVNKQLICYGDFNQLLPVGENRPYNKPHYLNYMFNTINTEYINWRNNFTKEYYDSIINGTPEYYTREVHRHSKGLPEKAEKVITLRRKKTAKSYNNMISFIDNKTMKRFPIGSQIICINNNLREELHIFNSKEFTITNFKEAENMEQDGEIIEIKECMYILRDINNVKYKLTKKQLFKNFDYAYALNIHRVQGKTLKSYYWAKEDDCFLTGRMAYTIISRLQQD
jgi:hypothetical protein